MGMTNGRANGMTNDVGTLFLDYSDRKLVQMMKTMTACLERLDDEQIWGRGGEHENALETWCCIYAGICGSGSCTGSAARRMCECGMRSFRGGVD